MLFLSRRALLLLLLLLTGGAYLPVTTPTLPVEHLFRVLAERLVLQHEVARWKWHAKRPIEDEARERILLAGVQEKAGQYGLDPAWVAAVFKAQIEAGKTMQRADFTTWHLEGPPPAGPSLTVIRARLDRVSDELLEALAQAEPSLRVFADPDRLEGLARQRLTGPGIDDAIRREVLRPVLQGPQPAVADR